MASKMAPKAFIARKTTMADIGPGELSSLAGMSEMLKFLGTEEWIPADEYLESKGFPAHIKGEDGLRFVPLVERIKALEESVRNG